MAEGGAAGAGDHGAAWDGKVAVTALFDSNLMH